MKALILSIFTLGLLTTTATAQSTAVFPVRGTNLEEGAVNALGALLASSYRSQTDDRVAGPDETAPALAEAGTERDAAIALGVAEYIVVSAVRLNERIAIDAIRYNKHGSKLYHSRATALSLDDAQTVADRLAAALHRRTEIEHTRTVDNVMAKEARKPTRTYAEQTAGVRTGVVFPFAPDLEPMPMLLAQLALRLDGPDYFIEFAGGLMLPSSFNRHENEASVGGLIGQLGAGLYLMHGSTSPYLSGGFSPRLVAGDYSGAGLTANGSFGVMFLRHATTRLYVEARVDQHLLPLGTSTRYEANYDSEGNYVSSSTERNNVWPTELSIAVGIGW